MGQRKEDLLINSLIERVNKDNIEEELPREDAYARSLHERDLMIQRDMIPADIQKELDKGDYTRILT